jgi:signal transduction histidine kinase
MKFQERYSCSFPIPVFIYPLSHLLYTLVKGDGHVDKGDFHSMDRIKQNNDIAQRNGNDSHTFVIKGRKRALREAYNRSLNVRHSYYCITGNELAKSYKPFIPPLQLQIHQYGGSCHIITNIEMETIPAARELSEAGAQIRHMDSANLRRCVIYDDTVAYFSIVEEPIITHSAIKNVEETEGEDLWIASTELSVIQSAKRHFLSDWENAVVANDRINELEQGKPIEVTRIIKDNKEAVSVYKSLAGSVQHEALYLLPSARALTRTKHAGILDSLIKAAEQRQAKIRMLCPVDSENQRIFEELKSNILYHNDNIEFKVSESTKSTILIVDREHVFTSELRNNSIYDIYEALSLSTYSNSKPTVESYVTLFESLWKQKEFADKLEQSRKNLELANEKLKIHDKMQREFIDVAAHELRTPVQPILSLTEVLKSKIKDKEQEELLSVVIRNAKRLRQLTQNILDVTKIESQSLQLKKELLNVNEVIMSVIADYGSGSGGGDGSGNSSKNNVQKANNKDVKITFSSKSDVFVMADRSRLYQVFANLLNNALKFTKEGTISITVHWNHDLNDAVVSVKDSGIGIDPEIIPRLFTKFATKPEIGGTGLGLFISKGIIEAHGGKIWAENNSDGRGAIFTFSLPL